MKITEEHLIEAIHRATSNGGHMGLFPPVQSVEQDAAMCAAVINLYREQRPHVMLPGWKEGVEMLKNGFGSFPAFWQPIQCECGEQVYYDLMHYRHRCGKCGKGF